MTRFNCPPDCLFFCDGGCLSGKTWPFVALYGCADYVFVDGQALMRGIVSINKGKVNVKFKRCLMIDVDACLIMILRKCLNDKPNLPSNINAILILNQLCHL